jgi:membrane protease YdiL (CAAX protease family)
VHSQSFIQFLLSPTWREGRDDFVFKDYILFVVKTVGITLLGALLILGINTILFSIYGINAQEYYLPLQDIRDQSLVDIVFYFIIFAPVVEEIIFRLWISPRKYYLVLGSMLLTIGLIVSFKGERWWILSSFLVGPAVSLVPDKILRTRQYLMWVVYLSSLIFAAAHIYNYTSLPNQWYLIPFLVLPQFWCGLCFAYVRLQAGLQWSVLTHSVYNTVILVITLLLRAY